ncbi:MAG: hypothetical protein ACOY0T_34525 [Myxococcota bacterium]
MTWRRAALFALLAAGGLGGACTEPSLEVGYDDLRVGSGGNGGQTGEGGSGGDNTCHVATCPGKNTPYHCGDCIDNDGDGKVDAEDEECTGPCDNTEDSFFGGIPGQSGGGCRRDCYFDQDSGNGNDRCDWSYNCDQKSQPPNFPPSGDATCAYDEEVSLQGATCAGLRETQTPTCLETCLPITPNGCDCFGCCELPARSGTFVWLGSQQNGVGSCDLEHINDRSACALCTPVPSCFNPCGDCEVCAGSTALDAGCSGSSPLCPVGTPCGPGATCPGTAYCITGCCIEIPR